MRPLACLVLGGCGAALPPPPMPEVPEVPPRLAVRVLTFRGPDALPRAWAAWREVQAGAEAFAVARARSDGPSAPRGGLLGPFEPGTFPAPLEAAVATAAPGELGPVVALGDDVYVVQRLAPDERVYRWVAYRADDPALERRVSAAREALAAGTPPSAIPADQASADPGERIGRHAWAPSVEQEVWDLPVGAVSEPVSTGHGVVVVQRVR